MKKEWYVLNVGGERRSVFVTYDSRKDPWFTHGYNTTAHRFQVGDMRLKNSVEHIRALKFGALIAGFLNSIYPDGIKSCDCIELPKSLIINE